MNSLFPFLRRDREDQPGAATPDDPAAALPPSAPETAVATMNSAPSQDQILTDMLDELRDFQPPSVSGLPEPSISITRVQEQPVGLGNHVGHEARGAFTIVALKGGRLQATVRFQFWANTPGDLDEAANALHGRLLAAKDDLWAVGFLRIMAETTSGAEPITSIDAWRKTVDYQVLYEYHYQDTEGARGLIARIPIDVDSQYDELTVVTDEMVRWDDEGASDLVVPGRTTIGQLSALVSIPGDPPTGAVTLKRTFTGASGPPADHGTLAAFLTAVTDSHTPERHGQVTFASLSDFLAAFDTTGDGVTLSGKEEDDPPVDYLPGKLHFEPAIQLPDAADHLELIYQDDAFDQVAVLYLRATPG